MTMATKRTDQLTADASDFRATIRLHLEDYRRSNDSWLVDKLERILFRSDKNLAKIEAEKNEG